MSLLACDLYRSMYDLLQAKYKAKLFVIDNNYGIITYDLWHSMESAIHLFCGQVSTTRHSCPPRV